MPGRKTPFPPALTPKSGPDRRGAVRHECDFETPFRIGDHFGTARLRDLSAGGAGLLLPRQVGPGGLVTLELRNRTQNSWLLKLLRVVHATPKSAGQWLVGSAFTQALTAEELAAVLP